ncbi:MAG: hypothetical protein J0I41_24230 [Filimonas sp.]|nr:hypothetical protein [Filimonas sp.]
MTERLITCDIDGILNNYPQCWLDFLEIESGIKHLSVEDAKKNEPAYRKHKDNYRKSSFKANLPVNALAVQLLQALNAKGYRIVMATSRPIDDISYPELRSVTESWLHKNAVPFHKLVFKSESVDFIHQFDQIDFHIEDDIKYATSIAENGIKTFLYNQFNNYDKLNGNSKLIVVSSLSNILSQI